MQPAVGPICSLGEPGHIVRGTEVHDGLKFQEKYLQRESAKKIFFFGLENS